MLWGADFITFYNAGYAAILGDKQSWALGRPLQEVWPEAWESLYGMLKGVIQTGRGSWAEDQIYFLRRNGFAEESYFTFSFARIIDERGGFGGILCTAIETTQKVINERRLKILRELDNRASAETTVEGVCRESLEVMGLLPKDIPFATLTMMSSDGLSAELSDSFGFPDGNGALDLVKNSESAMKQVIENGIPLLVRILRPDVEPASDELINDLVNSVFLLPIKLSSGTSASGILCIGLSPHLPFEEVYRSFLILVAGQVSAAIASAKFQEEARSREKKLAELDKLKTIFFSNISHEFRTPLTLLLGPLDDILERHLGDEITLGRQEIELVHRNALRLLKLVNSLLDFSRMEAGRSAVFFEPVDLSALTLDLASQFRSVMEKGNLNFQVQIDTLSEPVLIDKEFWEKIVFNLLSNAFKFTFQGSVQVTLTEHTDTIEFSVQDSGTGIKADEIPKLFDRFHRVEGARSRSFEGSGIGLALVREMVNALSGEIHVESIEEKGTIFRIILPKDDLRVSAEKVIKEPVILPNRLTASAFIEEAGRWVTEPVAELQQSDTKPTILIVDDNSDMRDYLVRKLNPFYNVLSAVNGLDALSVIHARLPELVITDMMMPEMDGFKLLKALRAQEKTALLPIIFLSAHAGQEATIEGLEAGADDYLVKPFSGRELLARVKTQLSMVKLRSELESERRTLLARDEFLSIASHELNTPLTPIKLQVQILTKMLKTGDLATIEPEKLKSMVNMLDRQIDKMSNLIRDLLDVTRISQGSLVLERKPTDLSILVQGVVELFQEEIRQAKCEIILAISDKVTAYCDAPRIEQVLTNLLTNALKYAPGKPIKISTLLQRDQAVIIVSDQGPGIVADDLEQIFDRYKRINATSNLGGLGLGLYISRQIVETHGGKIRVSSQPGQGCTFSIELPVS